jgi:SAM-dependent methyltransferase
MRSFSLEQPRVSTTALMALVVISGLAALTTTAGCESWEDTWNRRQPADKVMDAVGIAPGMAVAEIGAGTGRYAVQVAGRIGPQGLFYAEDIDADALAALQERCRRDKIDNIVTVLGEVVDPKLPDASCDFVYCINTYHHLEKPVPLLRNAMKALKASGKLVIIEHSPEKAKEHGFEGHCTPADSVLAQARVAGYGLSAQHSFLELDEIYVFEPLDRTTGTDEDGSSP